MSTVQPFKQSVTLPVADRSSLALCENIATWRYEQLPEAVDDAGRAIVEAFPKTSGQSGFSPILCASLPQWFISVLTKRANSSELLPTAIAPC